MQLNLSPSNVQYHSIKSQDTTWYIIKINRHDGDQNEQEINLFARNVDMI